MGHAQDCGRAGIGAVLVLAAWSPARSAAPRSVFRGFLKLFVRPHSVSVYSPLGCLEPLISRPGAHGSLSSAEGIAGGLPSPGASGALSWLRVLGGRCWVRRGPSYFPKVAGDLRPPGATYWTASVGALVAGGSRSAEAS